MACQRELFDDALLIRRLETLGLPALSGIEAHDNHSVMVSVTAGGVLRVHRAYAYAPDPVLAAIVAFIRPSTRRDRRREALRAILAFPVERFTPARLGRRRLRTHPEDRVLMRKLSALHRTLNDRFFGGQLSSIRVRVSRRMKRRLGELTLCGTTGEPLELTVGLNHVHRDGWEEVEHTLLHEMIHQWQAENALPVDHGAIFRRKAKQVGVVPRATRDVGRAIRLGRFNRNEQRGG